MASDPATEMVVFSSAYESLKRALGHDEVGATFEVRWS